MSSDPETTLFVVAVAVIIRRGNTFLAMRRALTKDAGPGLWEAPSGRVQEGEALLEAAAREVQEECGLTIRLDPRPLTSYPATRLGLPMIVIVYRADYLSGEVKLSEEHDRYRWLTPEMFAETSSLTPLIQAARLAFNVGAEGDPP
jgi:8-oxo-dGTP diphosphatase